jgi:uncharacterized Zn-finger protein
MDKIFKCPVDGCSKAFNEKGILKTHLRIHTGDRPYKCTYIDCKEAYSTKSILIEHQKKMHYGFPPYPEIGLHNESIQESSLT